MVLDADVIVVPASAGPGPAVAYVGHGAECPSDGVFDLVRRDLRSGDEIALSRGVERTDEGAGPDSHGGGRYVGFRCLEGGVRQAHSDLTLIFRDRVGQVVDEPAIPVPEPCGDLQPGARSAPHTEHLTRPLSPDGATLATTVLRPGDANARLMVVDLASAVTLMGISRSPSSAVAGFDGRWVVLSQDTSVHPELAPDDRGSAVAGLAPAQLRRGRARSGRRVRPPNRTALAASQQTTSGRVRLESGDGERVGDHSRTLQRGVLPITADVAPRLGVLLVSRSVERVVDRHERRPVGSGCRASDA